MESDEKAAILSLPCFDFNQYEVAIAVCLTTQQCCAGSLQMHNAHSRGTFIPFTDKRKREKNGWEASDKANVTTNSSFNQNKEYG